MALEVLLSQCQRGKKQCDESEEERAGRLTQKQKQRQRAKMQSLPCEICGKINEYERAAASEAKNECILAFVEATLSMYDLPFFAHLASHG